MHECVFVRRVDKAIGLEMNPTNQQKNKAAGDSLAYHRSILKGQI